MLVTRRPRWGLVIAVVVALGLLLVMPVAAVFAQAFADGLPGWVSAVVERHAVKAVLLTIQVVLIAVPLNLAFGMAAAWLITRFRMKGRTLLLTLIDLPFTISPVVSGLLFVLLFGARGVL